MRQLVVSAVIATCFTATIAAGETDTTWRLEVRGNELLYAGRPVRLRGVAVGDPVQSRENRDGSDYAVIAKDWKANVVRIALHPMYWKNPPHDKVLERLSIDVDAALKNGMFVILEWKVIGWPDGHYEIPTWGGPKDAYDSSFKLAKSFWETAAKKWGKDGRILFELWNEAIFSKEDWKPEVGQKWKELKPFLAELLSIVRQHTDNVVIVSSNHWSYYLQGIKNDLLAGRNIAYSWHVYAGHSQNDPKQWAAMLDDLQTVAPVIVTEWGFQRDTDRHYKGTADNFGTPFVRDFLEAKGLHNTAWCWHPWSGPPMLKEDWRTPNGFGQFVKDYLAKHNK